ELYHRLLLGQDKEVIESRWLTGVEDYLGEEIIEDIPSIPLRVFAATRLELEVPNEEWLRLADAETWERKVTQDFDARLKLGQTVAALQLVWPSFTPPSWSDKFIGKAEAALQLVWPRFTPPSWSDKFIGKVEAALQLVWPEFTLRRRFMPDGQRAEFTPGS